MAWSRRIESRGDQAERRLLEAFSDIGDVVHGDALVSQLRGHTEQPASLLAHWIVQRELINLSLHSRTLLPLFQFDLADWFARPNGFQQGSAPARTFEDDLPAVLQATRADRFVARGNRARPAYPTDGTAQVG